MQGHACKNVEEELGTYSQCPNVRNEGFLIKGKIAWLQSTMLWMLHEFVIITRMRVIWDGILCLLKWSWLVVRDRLRRILQWTWFIMVHNWWFQSCRGLQMTLDGNSVTAGYKILWVGRDGRYEVYDPMKKSWAHPGSMPSQSSYHCH